MANRTATLYIRITTADGKRRYCKAAYQSNGRLRPQYAMVNGEPEHHKDGVYYVRFVTVAEIQVICERSSEKLRGRDRRSCNLSTKLTTNEAKAVEEAASRAGKTPSEWARELLLGGVVVGSHTPMDMHIFAELVGIQMLLMNTLEPLLRGDKLTQEQLTSLFRQV